MPLSLSTDSPFTTGVGARRQDRAATPDDTRGESFKRQLATLGKEDPETAPAGSEPATPSDQSETAQIAKSLMEAPEGSQDNLQASEDASQSLIAPEETDTETIDETIDAVYPSLTGAPASETESASLPEDSDTSLLAADAAPETKTSQQAQKTENPSEEELDQAEAVPPMANPAAAVKIADTKDTPPSKDTAGQVTAASKVPGPETNTKASARAEATQRTLASEGAQMSSANESTEHSLGDSVSTGELAEETVSAQGADMSEAGSQKKTSDSPIQLVGGVTPSTTSAQTSAPTVTIPAAQPVSAGAYIAAPADIPTIVSQELSADNKHDKINIQLDPPELGRVSIEFKFDSQGLQHVLVTAESADAIRRIRAFHPDLVSVLEQNGLTSQDMTFREQSSGQNPSRSRPGHSMQTMTDTEASTAKPDINVSSKVPARVSSTGLDVRF